jgi:hypothetical protein
MLNRRVFFSTKVEFVSQLRKSYISDPVTIIAVDTKKLLQSHLDKVELSSKNSGAARMLNHTKSRETFVKLGDFPFHARSKPKELTVCHSVPDLKRLTVRIYNLAAHETFHP